MADVGDTITIVLSFFDAAGEPANPTTVGCWVKKPDNTVTANLDPVNSGAVGIYQVDYAITESGDHWIRTEATGLVKAASEKRLRVEEKRVNHA